MSTLLARMGLTRGRFVMVVTFVAAFAIFSFGYSFVGFIQPQHIHLHEYSLGGAIEELGGHFLFGVVVALPLLDLNMALLSGGLAVFLDSDHLLGAVNAPVSSRPDHSIFFVLTATIFIYAIASWKGMSWQERMKTTSVVPAAIMSHLSYDVFASLTIFGGRGYEFPLYVPFNFSLVPMPYYSFVLFELLGASLTAVVMVYTRRMNTRPPS